LWFFDAVPRVCGCGHEHSQTEFIAVGQLDYVNNPSHTVIDAVAKRLAARQERPAGISGGATREAEFAEMSARMQQMGVVNVGGLVLAEAGPAPEAEALSATELQTRFIEAARFEQLLQKRLEASEAKLKLLEEQLEGMRTQIAKEKSELEAAAAETLKWSDEKRKDVGALMDTSSAEEEQLKAVLGASPMLQNVLAGYQAEGLSNEQVGERLSQALALGAAAAAAPGDKRRAVETVVREVLGNNAPAAPTTPAASPAEVPSCG
jgi:hypothetical protein